MQPVICKYALWSSRFKLLPSQNELMDDTEVHYPQGFVMMAMGWSALALGTLALGLVGLNG